jgi:hypothetical protein
VEWLKVKALSSSPILQKRKDFCVFNKHPKSFYLEGLGVSPVHLKMQCPHKLQLLILLVQTGAEWFFISNELPGCWPGDLIFKNLHPWFSKSSPGPAAAAAWKLVRNANSQPLLLHWEWGSRGMQLSHLFSQGLQVRRWYTLNIMKEVCSYTWRLLPASGWEVIPLEMNVSNLTCFFVCVHHFAPFGEVPC